MPWSCHLRTRHSARSLQLSLPSSCAQRSPGKVVLLTTRHWRGSLCGCKRRTSISVVEFAGIFTSGTGLVLYISVMETFSVDSDAVFVRRSVLLDLIVNGANEVGSCDEERIFQAKYAGLLRPSRQRKKFTFAGETLQTTTIRTPP